MATTLKGNIDTYNRTVVRFNETDDRDVKFECLVRLIDLHSIIKIKIAKKGAAVGHALGKFFEL